MSSGAARVDNATGYVGLAAVIAGTAATSVVTLKAGRRVTVRLDNLVNNINKYVTSPSKMLFPNPTERLQELKQQKAQLEAEEQQLTEVVARDSKDFTPEEKKRMATEKAGSLLWQVTTLVGIGLAGMAAIKTGNYIRSPEFRNSVKQFLNYK